MIKKIYNYLIILKSNLYYKFCRKSRNSLNLLDASKTSKFILVTKCSLSRYGDGELDMVLRYVNHKKDSHSGFQQYDEKLANRLTQILKEGGAAASNHFVGLPGCMFSVGVSYLRHNAATFWKIYIMKNLSRSLSLINKEKTFLETNFTRFYLSHRDKTTCRGNIEAVKEIWKNRDVLIVEGDKTRLGVGNDLFVGARSIKRLLCPSVNAFGRYDKILAEIQLIAPPQSSNKLIICALGMTATVLAYDLAKLGYQAIDIGHIDIEYEWMLRGALEKVAIPGKYTNESINGSNVTDCKDPQYLSQIVGQII